MENVPTAAEMALGALRISRLLGWVSVPCFLLAVAGVFLLKGKHAGEVRIRIAVLNGSLILGTMLCTMWLLTSLDLNRGHWVSSAPDPLHSRATLLLTGPVLWRILPVFLAVAGHSLIYIAVGLRALPRSFRNKLASLLLGVAFVLSASTVIPQVRFWKALYSQEAMAASREALSQMEIWTDQLTGQWANEHPGDWEALFLRANVLYDSGKQAEAKAMDKAILRLSDENLPAGLRSFVARRLGQGERRSVSSTPR